MRWRWRIASVTTALGIVSLALLVTTQAGAALLLWALENAYGPVRPDQLGGKVEAIAVLGGRTARIHEAARLSLSTGLPLLLVGRGSGASGFAAESEKMEDILLRQYGIGPRWVETDSRNTRQNAAFAWCLVAPMGVRKVALLTDPFHMLRARAEFVSAGFEVVAAPTQDVFVSSWRPKFSWTLASFTPGRAGWLAARRPLFELGGAAAALFAPSPACGRGQGSGLPAS